MTTNVTETHDGEVDKLAATFPSIDLVYPLAVSAYDTAIKRFDSVDARLQTITAYVAAVSVVVPSIANTRSIAFTSIWFYLAVALFVVASVLGIYARLYGNLSVLSPKSLFNHWTNKSQIEFKKDLIYFSANDFERNKIIVLNKWRMAVAISVIFLLQVACLFAWVILCP